MDMNVVAPGEGRAVPLGGNAMLTVKEDGSRTREISWWPKW
ncbi:hypothetical protein ACFLIM_42675 [Nonomuraea sp. M3C6]|uniref:Uncharacterized protein n=1 Tax=Nonomuraea marmarensis TaxID=3351344 RepID=A0ABW7AUI8_9ACTN